jgi:hypothetical protein
MRVTPPRHLKFMQTTILAKIANCLCAVRRRVLACLSSIRAKGLAAMSHNQEVFPFSISKDPQYQILKQFKFHSICLQTRIIQIALFALQTRKFGPDFE